MNNDVDQIGEYKDKVNEIEVVQMINNIAVMGISEVKISQGFPEEQIRIKNYNSVIDTGRTKKGGMKDK